MCKYKCEEIVNVSITGIKEYGIFVKVDNEYTGLIHISEISDRYISDIKKIFVIGETLNARILEIDESKKQLKLSIKGLNSGVNKRKPLEDECRGFEPLKENLNNWVNEKLKDLKKTEK